MYEFYLIHEFDRDIHLTLTENKPFATKLEAIRHAKELKNRSLEKNLKIHYTVKKTRIIQKTN